MRRSRVDTYKFFFFKEKLITIAVGENARTSVSFCRENEETKKAYLVETVTGVLIYT